MCPTYDLECDCGFNAETVEPVSSPRLRKCPSCNKNSLVRLIGAGSGFSFRSGYTDKAGQSIDFKEPYFDTAMRRKFNSAKEKHDFMHKNGIVQNGDSDIKVKRERKKYKEETMDTKKRS